MHEIGEYKGNPTIGLKERDEDRPFFMGLRKCRLVIDNMDAIKEFVESNE